MQKYLNDLLCKFGPFCLQHSKTCDISQAFLRVTIAELSTLKQVRFFGPPCTYYSPVTIDFGPTGNRRRRVTCAENGTFRCSRSPCFWKFRDNKTVTIWPRHLEAYAASRKLFTYLKIRACEGPRFVWIALITVTIIENETLIAKDAFPFETSAVVSQAEKTTQLQGIRQHILMSYFRGCQTIDNVGRFCLPAKLANKNPLSVKEKSADFCPT